MSMRRLLRYLAELRRERGRPGRRPGRVNAIDVVLEVDAAVPWKLVAWMLEGFRSPFIEIRHSWFAVRHATDMRVGGVAYVWSGSFGMNHTRFIADGAWFQVLLQPAPGHADLQGLYERFRGVEEPVLRQAIVEIRPPGDTAVGVGWGRLLEVLDAVRGAGAGRLADLPWGGYEDTGMVALRPWAEDPPEEAALSAQRRWVRSHRRLREGVRILVDGEALPCRATASPRAPAARHGGPWGWTGDNVERWDLEDR